MVRTGSQRLQQSRHRSFPRLRVCYLVICHLVLATLATTPSKAKVRSALTADSHTQLPLRVPRSSVTWARGTATPTTYFNIPGRRQAFPWLAQPHAQPDKRATESLSLAQAAPAYSSRGVTQVQAAPTPRETRAPTSARTSKSTHGNAGAMVVTSIGCITTGGVRPRTCIHQEGRNSVISLRTLTAQCLDDIDDKSNRAQATRPRSRTWLSTIFVPQGTVGFRDLASECKLLIKASFPIERHSVLLSAQYLYLCSPPT
ncbi:hypothetical protein EDB89DRAFT_680317 [Lactarius sanguifluus]|nr:hypothetical protein EDB89DRAFT_680317 [Lactarius sanguifluus]